VFDKLKGILFILIGFALLDCIVIVFLAQKDIQAFIDLPYLEMAKPFLTPSNTFNQAQQSQFFNASQFVLLIVFGYICYEILFSKKNKVEESKNVKIHGDQRWGEASEYMNGYSFHKAVKHYKKDGLKNIYKNPPGTFFGLMNDKPLIMNDDQGFDKNKTRIPNSHTLVLGDSGSYKTYTFVLPNLLKEVERSIVVVDVKGSMVRRTAHIKKKQGYDVKIFDFINFAIGNNYNFMDYIEEPDNTRKVANAIISNLQSKSTVGNDSYWQKSAETLLTALINYVMFSGFFDDSEKNMGTVIEVFLSQSMDDEKQSTSDYLTSLFGAIEDANNPARISWMLFLSQLEAKEMMSSIFGTLNNQVLSLWLSNKLKEFTKSDSWNLNDFVSTNQKTIVYVTVPESDDTYRLLINTFFIQLFQLLAKSGRENGIVPTKPLMLLDEFANLGVVPKYENLLTVIREYQVKVCTLIQSLTQLDRLYGKDARNIIVSGHATQLILGVNDPETGRYVEEKLGNQTMEGTNISRTSSGRGSSQSENTQYHKQALMTRQQVEGKSSNEAILTIRGYYPAKLEVVDVFKFFDGVFTKEDEKNLNPLKYTEVQESEEYQHGKRYGAI